MDEKVIKYRKIRIATMGIEAIGFLSTLNGFLKYNTLTLILGLTMILVGIITWAVHSKCPVCGTRFKTLFKRYDECPHCNTKLNVKTNK